MTDSRYEAHEAYFLRRFTQANNSARYFRWRKWVRFLGTDNAALRKRLGSMR